MITLKFSSIDAHPKEIFKVFADRKAEIEWAKNSPSPSIPLQELAEYKIEQGKAFIKSKIKHNY